MKVSVEELLIAPVRFVSFLMKLAGAFILTKNCSFILFFLSTYASLTLPSCQNLFTFTWDQLHTAIDSPLCTDMIPPGCRANIQQFLHKC